MAEFVAPFDVEAFGASDTSKLTPLTGLEAPEDGGGDEDARAPHGEGPPGHRDTS